MLSRQFANDLHEVEHVLLLAFYQEHQADFLKNNHQLMVSLLNWNFFIMSLRCCTMRKMSHYEIWQTTTNLSPKSP